MKMLRTDRERRNVDAMAVNRAGAPTCLLGLIGKGIQASKSPALHETEAAAQGFHCSYEFFDLDYARDGRNGDVLPDLLREAEDRGFAGLNITYPCKQAIIPMLHELSDEARIVGAVNTVRFRDGRRVGYNTDAWGFAESFRRGLSGASLRRRRPGRRRRRRCRNGTRAPRARRAGALPGSTPTCGAPSRWRQN